MSTTPAVPVGSSPSINSARKLYFLVPGSTPAFVQVPIDTFEFDYKSEERKWWQVDVDGVTRQYSIITAVASTGKLETKAFQASASTPGLISVLTSIKSLQGKTGAAAQGTFVTVDPADGLTLQWLGNFMNIKTTEGDNSQEVKLKCDISVCGGGTGTISPALPT